jgi:ABC-type siderophore export system fused ATPase/permease subunit
MTEVAEGFKWATEQKSVSVIPVYSELHQNVQSKGQTCFSIKHDRSFDEISHALLPQHTGKRPS